MKRFSRHVHTSLALLGYFFLHIMSVSNGEMEFVLQKCCGIGSTWGSNHTTCTGPPSPVPDIPPEDRSTCLTAIYVCCIRIHRHLMCEKGKQIARRGHGCSLLQTSGGEAYKDCCDACQLGIIAGMRRQPCIFSNFAFGSPWDQVYIECCQNIASLEGTSPLTGGQSSGLCERDRPCSQLCNEIENNIQCSCYSGFRLALDQRNCEDINECALGTHNCNPRTECVNELGTFSCRPKNGSAQSNIRPGQCPIGYIKNSETQTCDDIDECAQEVCPPNEVCTNVVGSYNCLRRNPQQACPPGFRQHSATDRCVDIDECSEEIDTCNRDQELCVNSHGSYQCMRKIKHGKYCEAGFKWNDDERKCEDVDECVEELDDCYSSDECRNTIGGYECDPKCPEGQIFNELQQTCVEADHCASNKHKCKFDEVCVNIDNGFRCVKMALTDCPPGYKPIPALDGAPPSCVDVDECKEDLHSCDPIQQICVNEIGSYGCIPKEEMSEQIFCQNGFKYNFEIAQCTDVNECEEKVDSCNPTTELCVNTNGSYNCVKKISSSHCPPGYRANDLTNICEDINECEENKHKCLLNKENCVNLPGGYRCHAAAATICPNGYKYNASLNTCDDVDECIEGKHNCSVDSHLCVNVAGGFQCFPKPSCRPGYVFNVQRSMCVDVDECAEEKHSCDPDTQNCINSVGSYRCSAKVQTCPRGYRRVEDNCDDINECTENLDDCDVLTQDCVNTLGSYQCQTKIPPVQRCGTGFKYDPNTNYCEDIDECQEGTHTCDRNLETCVNSEGSFTCFRLLHTTLPPLQVAHISTTTPIKHSPRTRAPKRKIKYRTTPAIQPCRPGFSYDSIARTCVDIDECEQARPCAAEQTCQNTEGSYQCYCSQGYSLDIISRKCNDVNECQLNLHSCTPSQRCDNTIGSYSCVRTTSCGTGYTLNAHIQDCEDDDECVLGTHNCGIGFACRNTQGSFRCDRVRCPAGQRLLADGTCEVIICNPGMEVHPNGNCVDINECLLGNICQKNQRCINSVGSYSCHNLINCGIGFEMNEYGTQCVDIDECARRTAECGPQQICRNRPGGYNCDCPVGYALNAERQCEDVDECTRFQGQICSITSTCQNTQGSYTCNCKEGFKKADDGKNCIDIDECLETPNICHQTCINVWGSYQCSCQQGYTLGADGRSCQDIDECTLWEGRGNLCIGFCVNEPGSYSCSCPEGYRLSPDKRTCRDIDECQEQSVCRGENEVCLNTRGSFKCNLITCPPNYVRDREHRNRCKRTNLECRRGDTSCLNEPLSFSYNYITFVSHMRIPPSGQLDLFTMRGPRFTTTSVQFTLEFKDARAPEGIAPATRDFFNLRRTAFNEAMVSLIKTVPGPQEIELELVMKMYHNGLFGGTAVAKLFIFVTQHEF